jgi:hypothetical protein
MTSTSRHLTQFKVFFLAILTRSTLMSFQKSLKVMIMMQHRIMPNLQRKEIHLLALRRRTQMQASSPETLPSSIVCKLQFTLLKMTVILCQKALSNLQTSTRLEETMLSSDSQLKMRSKLKIMFISEVSKIN